MKKHYQHVNAEATGSFDFRVDSSDPSNPTVKALNDKAYKEMQENVPDFLIQDRTAQLQPGSEGEFIAGLKKEGWRVEVIPARSAQAAD